MTHFKKNILETTRMCEFSYNELTPHTIDKVIFIRPPKYD